MLDVILAVLRHALTAGGAALVARGVADAGTVEALSGGVLAAVSLGWSVLQKRRQAEAVKLALMTEPPR